MGHTHNADRVVYPVFVAIAGVVVVNGLLLILFILVIAGFPKYSGWAIGLYIGFVFAMAYALLRMIYRRGFLDIRSALWKPVSVLLAVIGLLTGALIAGMEVWPSWKWQWIVLYQAGIFYAAYRVLHWMADHLAFRCPECGLVFRGSVWTWAFSMNMGTRKNVRCPRCAQPRWVDIVSPVPYERSIGVDRSE